MSKNTTTAVAKAETSETKSTMTVVPAEESKAPEQARELTLEEKIQKVETLKLLVNKRSNIIATRVELDRFQVSSNDFNCALDLTDSDGNKFRTTFTPGVKKVIEFLKKSFDDSAREIEQQIQF